jgi:uroporphyrinogen decarboxylase
MTPREKFITALECAQPPGRVPHFELEFFLTMEAFGRVHASQRRYHQWNQMSEKERKLHRRDVADLVVTVARTYEHSAIMPNVPRGWEEKDTMRYLEVIRGLSGMEYFLCIHGGATYGIPGGDRMVEFVMKLSDRPQEMKDDAARRVDDALARGERYKAHGALDGMCLCTDYCFNEGPFLSPAMFDEFVTPYMVRLVQGYKDMGFYTILHTDGNIMPILDRLASTGANALHSLDPQGGVDIAEVKRLLGDRMCLIGNVNCALLQTGTDEEVIESARYALTHGMPGGGYVFATSNCVYTGMPLERYELMLDVWRKEGNYD